MKVKGKLPPITIPIPTLLVTLVVALGMWYIIIRSLYCIYKYIL